MSLNCLWAVPINGSYSPRKKYVVKETPKTFVVSPFNNDAWLASTIRKATMSTSYERYYTDEESANKFYSEIKKTTKEKTADEMFEELGYKRDYPNEPQGLILYSDKKQYSNICISDFRVSKNIKICQTWESLDLTFKEILACAKLIEEME